MAGRERQKQVIRDVPKLSILEIFQNSFGKSSEQLDLTSSWLCFEEIGLGDLWGFSPTFFFPVAL